MNDRVAIRVLGAMGFGTLAIQGFLLRMDIELTTLSAFIAIAFIGAAWAVRGKQ